MASEGRVKYAAEHRLMTIKNMCNCKNVELGSFDNQIEIYHKAIGRKIWLDACIADEVISLLNSGVRTTGSCCGHNKTIPSIVVALESIPLMEAMGYKHWFNLCVPRGSFSRTFFYAKSVKCPWWIKMKHVWLPWVWYHFFKLPE